jgi:hypothetical protein
VLLQTDRRLASATFRRESVCWSEDRFSPPSNLLAPANTRAESVSQLTAMPTETVPLHTDSDGGGLGCVWFDFWL